MATRTPRPTVPATAQAGVISFTQPPQTAAASYYKIAPGNPITFGWNFTAIIVTPTALTVSAYCQSNGNTYPVGPTDGVIEGAATQVVWNPYEYEQGQNAVRLAQAEYTIMIHDERGADSAIRGGYLTPYTGTKFSLYRPREYVPLESWTCDGCSAALPSASATRPTTIALIATCLIILLSGMNLLRRR